MMASHIEKLLNLDIADDERFDILVADGVFSELNSENIKALLRDRHDAIQAEIVDQIIERGLEGLYRNDLYDLLNSDVDLMVKGRCLVALALVKRGSTQDGFEVDVDEVSFSLWIDMARYLSENDRMALFRITSYAFDPRARLQSLSENLLNYFSKYIDDGDANSVQNYLEFFGLAVNRDHN